MQAFQLGKSSPHQTTHIVLWWKVFFTPTWLILKTTRMMRLSTYQNRSTVICFNRWMTSKTHCFFTMAQCKKSITTKLFCASFLNWMNCVISKMLLKNTWPRYYMSYFVWVRSAWGNFLSSFDPLSGGPSTRHRRITKAGCSYLSIWLTN